MTVAGSRLAARSAADEGSRPPVNRANNSAPPTLKSALSSPRAPSSSLRSVELKLLPLSRRLGQRRQTPGRLRHIRSGGDKLLIKEGQVSLIGCGQAVLQ